MYDKILDFIEDHRILCIIGIVLIVLFIAGLSIRSINHSKHEKELAAKEEEQRLLEEQAQLEAEAAEAARLAEEEANKEPESEYQASLGLIAKTDGRIEYEDAEPEPEPEPEPVEKKPTYKVEVNIFDKTGVPEVNVDGSKFSDYLANISLADFGTFWGSDLTEDDYNSTTKYLVGVEQDYNDFERGDLQSVGWVFDNIDNLPDNAAIKFTNLHVIDSLSPTHVALICSYDWYSVFGLKDTLVVFEDISNTLSTSDFENGSVFSATVFKHNIKVVEDVAGQRVLCVQYDTFD